jgi:hypothetical protein
MITKQYDYGNNNLSGNWVKSCNDCLPQTQVLQFAAWKMF